MRAAVVVPLLLALAAGTAGAQELQLSVYGDVDYSVSHTAPTAGDATTDNAFAIPTLDVFLSGSAQKLSFIAELLFEVTEGTNSFAVDVDRLQLSYQVNDWLKATFGRYQTAIGYYNTTYPIGGAIFLVAFDRPTLVSRNPAESLLPIESVGLNLEGHFHIGDPTLRVDLAVSNGRGRTAAELVQLTDFTVEKALNLRVQLELSGFVVGASAYVDWLPALGDDEPGDTIREQIFGVHVAYTENPYYLIAEAAVIEHINDDLSYATLGSLVEMGYAFGNVMPYARLELAEFPGVADPFWARTMQQARGDYQAVSVGAKWTATEKLALKLELEANHGETDTFYSVTIQAAFGF